MITYSFPDICTIASPIISAIAIIVALCVSRRSSKDAQKQIESAQMNSGNQIQTIRKLSEAEIKQIRILVHTLMIGQIYSLESANLQNNSKKDEIVNTISQILAKYENIKNYKIDSDNIDIEQINSHFEEVSEVERLLIKAYDDLIKIQNTSSAISKALENLKNSIDAFCEK